MKKYMFLALVAFMSHQVLAQKTGVRSGTEMVGKISRTGLQTTLAADEKTVSRAWKDYLDRYGKVSSSRDEYTMESAKITAFSERPVRVLSKVTSDKGNTTVFYAVDLGSAYINTGDSRYGAAEKFLRDFAMQFYKDQIGDQVKDAEKELANAERELERKTQKEAELNSDLERNKKEIEEWQRKIEENKQAQSQIARDMEANKKAKEQAIGLVERQKKVVEAVKAKLSGVE